MQFKQTLVRLVLILLPFSAFSQTTYFPQGDKANILIERLEIKRKNDSALNFSKNRPFSRYSIISNINQGGTPGQNKVKLSRVDQYNLNSLMMNNIEFAGGDWSRFKSKKPIAKRFYQTPANLYEVHIKDFDLVINPVIQVVISKEKDNDETLYLNTRGLNLRGKIANKIGFYAYITDNQEKDPMYVRDWVNRRKAVPGQGFYKDFKGTGYDYFDARGYFTFNITKYIDATFGYDKNFIGNGYRSMFLGDAGNSNLFLKLNTRIWKINYQNLFMELHNADNRTGLRLFQQQNKLS